LFNFSPGNDGIQVPRPGARNYKAPAICEKDDKENRKQSAIDSTSASSALKIGVGLKAKSDNGGRFAMTHPKSKP